MEACALVSLLLSTQFLMGKVEICFKMQPGLIGWVAVVPHFAVVGKHTGFEDEVVGGGDHLLRQIWIVGGGCNVHDVVDLINENLHRLIHVVIGAHLLVIFLKSPIQNFRIIRVKVLHNILSGDVGASNIFVPEGSNVGLMTADMSKDLREFPIMS